MLLAPLAVAAVDLVQLRVRQAQDGRDGGHHLLWVEGGARYQAAIKGDLHGSSGARTETDPLPVERSWLPGYLLESTPQCDVLDPFLPHVIQLPSPREGGPSSIRLPLSLKKKRWK